MPRIATGAAVNVKKTKNGIKQNVWYARIRWQENGVRKERRERPTVNTKTAAKELAQKMLAEKKTKTKELLAADKITFNQLADFFLEKYVIPAEYRDSSKTRGYRSHYEVGLRVKMLKSYFGSKLIQSFEHEDLENFKDHRLKTPVVLGRSNTGKGGNITTRERSIGTINKELGVLRRIFTIAVQKGWVSRNPFKMGGTLISQADEKKRDRILTKDEETKLLAVCVNAGKTRRAHLKVIIIMALDTGIRRGEMMALKWGDIDFENRQFRLKALNTKTIKERDGGLSKRLFAELEALYNSTDDNSPDAFVFHHKRSKKDVAMKPKKAFERAVKDAGLEDLKFHDLRHTLTTRLVASGMPLAEIARITGHEKLTTLYRYINLTKQTVQKAVALVDQINEE